MTVSRQYHPLPGEFVAVGVVGILLFSVVFFGSCFTLFVGVKGAVSKAFFCCLATMAVLEFPRYFSLAIDVEYDSIAGYCCHIIAGSFFFAAFTLMCYQWVDLLAITEYFRYFYGRNGLIAANVVFGCVDVSSCCFCATQPSLQAYFQSQTFRALNLLEAMKNLLYSAVLSYYGIKLIVRLRNYTNTTRIIGSNSSSGSINSSSSVRGTESTDRSGGCDIVDISGSSSSSYPHQQQQHQQQLLMSQVVQRVTAVLAVASLCFCLRVCMLVAKTLSLHGSNDASASSITTPTFTLFGFLWFLTADFIPRTLPSFAFIFLMRTKAPGSDSNNSSSSGGIVTTTTSGVKLPQQSASSAAAVVAFSAVALEVGETTTRSALHANGGSSDSDSDDGTYKDYG